MNRAGAIALLAVSLGLPAQAHRLDEYLQATLIGVMRNSVEVEVHLTPGVAVLPIVMASIDRNGDGRISADEERAYAELVVRDLELRVDGLPIALSLAERTFPTLEQMREGLGAIRLTLRGVLKPDSARHILQFSNRHLPHISAYLVNCLAGPARGADRLSVGRQERDEIQRSIRFSYSFADGAQPAAPEPWFTRGPLWVAVLGTVLAARIAVVGYQAGYRGPTHLG